MKMFIVFPISSVAYTIANKIMFHLSVLSLSQSLFYAQRTLHVYAKRLSNCVKVCKAREARKYEDVLPFFGMRSKLLTVDCWQLC